LELSDFTFTILDKEILLHRFDCDDADINEFLHEDALRYHMQKIANTYLFLDDEREIVAFFSISNDCLNDLGKVKGYTNTVWNRFHRKTFLPNEKRIRQYPAIKIGRLGVSKNYQRNGLAYQLMDFIKGWALIDHKPACRLLLLDAYNKERQVKYYQRNGFNLLLDDDATDRTRIMYFDLQRLQ
jgi:GNAT superfamily N-acetyltransferase